LELTHKLESKINNLREQSELSVKLSTENNTTIEMVQNLLKELQNSCDTNKIDINNLAHEKVTQDV